MSTLISTLFQALKSPSSRRAAMGLLAFTLMACTNPMLSNKGPLYLQLGGVEGIQQVVARTLDRVAQDPRTQRTFQGIKMPFLKNSVGNYVCVVADGPCLYEGADMKKSHAALHLKGAEFDLMVEVLREELDGAGVSTAAKNELLRRLAPSRRDMVTP